MFLSAYPSSLNLKGFKEGNDVDISGAKAVDINKGWIATAISNGDLPYRLSLDTSLADVCKKK